jgi:replicative DNA helicase
VSDATPSTYELAADDVLAVMLNDETCRQQAVYEYSIMPAHMPTLAHRKLYEAILACMAAGEPIHDTALLEKCGSVVTLDFLSQRAVLSDDSRKRALPFNAAKIRKHGMSAGTRNILKIADDELAAGKPYDNVTARLVTALTSLDSGEEVIGETADARADKLSDLLDSEPVTLPSTGLPWLDLLTGGVDRGHIWWIGAPYKSRKSTVMLNIAVGMLMSWFTRGCVGEPPSVGIGSGEMFTERIDAQIAAMLAVAYIKRRGWWQERFTIGSTAYPLHMISADTILKARANHRSWDPRRVEAIRFAVNQLRAFGKASRVYDRRPKSGNLTSFQHLISAIRRDKHIHKANVFFVDYLQIFRPPSEKLFDFMSSAALELQTLAGNEGVTLVVLAQQNEETIKTGAGYSAGIKGGGDAAATADYLLTSLYKSGDLADDDTKIELTMKLSRHGMGGGDTKRQMDIHPMSGLLMESDWIGRL